MKEIKIKGARVHNLKHFDITIPKNKLIVATGVSGSGKSSLVFDLIFEEAQKQYLQSIGLVAGIDDEDKFDEIQGLGPAIAVQQNLIRQSNPRSTVGTKTGILTMLSIIYAGESDYKPEFFSYNTSSGMCLKCSGKGSYYELHMDQLIKDPNITLGQLFRQLSVTSGFQRVLDKRFGDYYETPFQELPDEVRDEVIYGRYENGKRSYCLLRIFEGRFQKGENVGGIYARTTCCDCHGYRVGEEAQSVFLHGKHIGQLGQMTIHELHEFMCEVIQEDALPKLSLNVAKDVVKKLEHLIKSRLGYLTLYRELSSLSGGEIQRIFLNSHLDSKMDSLIYVLDEPTAGLHASEKEGILQDVQRLKDMGNTVFVVEHNKEAIRKAEHIIDIGPKAGIEGGQVIYQGDYQGLLDCKESITGRYLSQPDLLSKVREAKDVSGDAAKLTLSHVTTNNLKDITVSIPLHAMIGVAGKSGSGKSSLISNTLIPLLRSYFNHNIEPDLGDEEESDEMEDNVQSMVERVEGMESISGFVEISQAPIGRNMNSNPVSYIGIWDKIRKLFAAQKDAIHRDLTPGHFSFHSKGACKTCAGSGYEKIWIGSNLSINKICSECHGTRFNEAALSIYYHNKNIYDVLEMSVSEAIEFFGDSKDIIGTLKILDQIGMGYIKLGQPTPTLSGGEAQRIKLAKEIGYLERKGKSSKNILYVLDEPTTGLSQYDIAKLLHLLDELVQNGNSVVVVEHDIDVLKSCDWIIELGPEGGLSGGQLIAQGTPKDLMNNTNSITGGYMA